MCGCTNNNNGSNQCTILLIIIIFALQGLLNGSGQSRTALILLFLFWLCGNNRSGNFGMNQCNNSERPMNRCMPMNNCCMPEPCCCESKRRRRRRKDSCTCKCERVKICCNSGNF